MVGPGVLEGIWDCPGGLIEIGCMSKEWCEPLATIVDYLDFVFHSILVWV